MSLGFTSIWRARPLRLSPSFHGQSLFALPRSTPGFLATRLRYATLAEDIEALEKGGFNDSNHVKKSAAYKRRKKPEKRSDGLEKMDNEETAAEIRDIEEALERSNFANSVIVPRYKSFGTSRHSHRSKRAHHKAVSAQVHHERNRVNVNGRAVDWRIVLEEMARSTPEHSLEHIEHGISVIVDKDVLARLLKATGDDKLGAIRRRTGATIKVSRDESMLLLSGTRQAINMATDEFRNLAGTISVTRHYRPLEPGESEIEEVGNAKEFFVPPLSRDEGAYHKKTRLSQHVDLIPVPTKWTAKTLEDYVISLVDTYVDPFLHAPIYPSSPNAVPLDHERAVTRRLVRLFQSLPPEAGVSCSVLKLAMSNMTKKGEKFLPEVRSLFVLMDRRGIPMDADVFNILLKAPVKTRNLRKFRQTIRSMTQRGFAPNLDTWLLFLRMFDSVEVKSHILQAMNAKNMLGTPEAIQRIAQEMAPYDAEHAATQRKDLATFLQEQDDRYGPDWLTRDAGNKVLHVLGEYGRYEDAFTLLDLMSKRYHDIPKDQTHERLAARPDVKSFKAIIHHAWIKGKIPLAVNVVRKMKTRGLVKQPGLNILHLLFEMAWKARLRTTIVVIWRYASLARLTSYRMRQRVAALLSREPGGPEDPGMTETVYHHLGGEVLARELVGGRKVLERIRALCTQTWGENFPRGKLGVIATKILPTAFADFGPAVSLGKVLCQSVLVDFKCLHARKINRLKSLLATAKVKGLPLWQRREEEETWTDLAPLDAAEPATIKHDDFWKDEWESEGWIAKSRVWISDEWRDQFDEAYRIWQAKKAEQGDADPAESLAHSAKSEYTKGEEANDVEHMQRLFAKSLAPLIERRMAIINPMVWNDEQDDISAMGEDSRTQLQKQNEEAILDALEQVSKDYHSFEHVFADDGGTSSRSQGEGQGEDFNAEDETAEAGDPDVEAEDRLERIQQMLTEAAKTHRDEARLVHDYEKNDKAKPEEAKE